jgi:H+/Cl- antiporter ClcA
MAAAYGVPLGGALFALEVLRGMLALRLVLPALLTSLVATTISWLVLPNAPTYQIPAFLYSAGTLAWALLIGPIAGIVAVGYVRAVAWADRNTPTGWQRWAAPVLALGLIGLISIKFPQLLGNGRDLSELLFKGGIASSVLQAKITSGPINWTGWLPNSRRAGEACCRRPANPRSNMPGSSTSPENASKRRSLQRCVGSGTVI